MGSGHWPRPISNGMKKNLLVTLADKNYLDQAKQLFSSVYFNAGWQGDYMILVPSKDKNEPALEWFREKGIIVKVIEPLYGEVIESVPRNETFIKFKLFTPEFKKWDHIIYADVDIIIKASLDSLTEVKGFSAVKYLTNLSSHFLTAESIKYDDLALSQYKKLSSNYNLNIKSFSTGFFVFNTDIIKEDTLDKLSKLFYDYYKLGLFGEEQYLTLFFNDMWEKLPQVYNVYVLRDGTPWGIKPSKINGIIIHFPGPSNKVWNHQKHFFYQEWKDNLDKADNIDLNNIPAGNKWSKRQIINYSNYLNLRYILFIPYYYIDRKIGQLGLLLKKYLPRIYKILKKLKGQNK